MKTVCILGCGWLGLPLGAALTKKFRVKGSTTSENKLPVLESHQIEPFLIALFEDRIEGDLQSFLSDSQILIIDIPPKAAQSDFTKKIERLIPYIKNSVIEKVIFISSTSVYGDGEQYVTEATPTQPETESGKQLVIAEQLLQNHPDFKTTVIRFGGLIGQDRHPARSLSGRKGIENPDSPINLIHQKDCICIISKVIEDEIYGETFNAVAPFHPTRKEYYTEQAIAFHLPPPEFSAQLHPIGKTILSEKLQTVLDYTFQVPKL